jgi:arsenite-transporting ATPase
VLYELVVSVLKDPLKTLLVLVSRSEVMSLKEAERASIELKELGLKNQRLIINGLFLEKSEDHVAFSFAQKSKEILEKIPAGLKAIPVTKVFFRPAGVMGISALKSVCCEDKIDLFQSSVAELAEKMPNILKNLYDWETLLLELEAAKKGVIMTMGKGGVGKTTMAAMIAAELAHKGYSVLLSTTDPAAHIFEVIDENLSNLHIDRIDPKTETVRYVENVLERSREKLSAQDMALLEEELRSPCIEEIAVFRAFAHTVAQGDAQFIVLDTAPTGHTLLLLDTTEAYHREVARSSEDIPEEVKGLLPRIRDSQFTRVLIVTLPEATPTHEAASLQNDLRRAGIDPYAWIINRSFAVSGTKDPTLCAKAIHELPYIREILESLSEKVVLSPWIGEELTGIENLFKLKKIYANKGAKNG